MNKQTRKHSLICSVNRHFNCENISWCECTCHYKVSTNDGHSRDEAMGNLAYEFYLVPDEYGLMERSEEIVEKVLKLLGYPYTAEEVDQIGILMREQSLKSHWSAQEFQEALDNIEGHPTLF